MPSTTIQYFEYEHLPVKLQDVSWPVLELAHLMEETLPDGAEKSAVCVNCSSGFTERSIMQGVKWVDGVYDTTDTANEIVVDAKNYLLR